MGVSSESNPAAGLPANENSARARVARSEQFLLIQMSDLHVGADWGNRDALAMLTAAVDSVHALGATPDAVLVSGDLADNAADDEYEQVKEALERLDAPIYVLPGNHDDRNALHRHFGVPGKNGEPVQYAETIGPLRLVALDSTRPGEDRGELDPARLAWLEDALQADPETPTLLALHHAPVTTGIPVLDELGLPADDRLELAEVVRRHAQILQIVAGHLHRTILATVGGRPVLAVPSTLVQGRLRFGATEIELSAEPSCFAVHTYRAGELVSHVQPISY